MVNKYNAVGFVGGLFLPIIADVVGGGAVTMLAKGHTKDFGKGVLVAGVVGVGLIAVLLASGTVVTMYRAVLY